MSKWWYQGATELASAVREKRISCIDLLEVHLERVRQHNGSVNAVIVLDEARARQRARAADAALKSGKLWGALHGVPMTVKESFDVAGLPTTWGVPALRNNIARSNAAAIEALLAAGAVIFGKTNVPMLLADWQSFNAIYGSTNNPWDLRRTPGGSSGGSGAALAAGMTPLELGSDIGASIRSPANFCGVYGHKPSFGIVPQYGHGIPGAQVPIDMLVCGPLARSAEDLALALEILAGPEPANRAAWRLELPKPRARALKDFRVAVKVDDPNCAVDGEVVARVQAVADAIAKAGGKVNEKARPRIDTLRAHAMYVQLLRGATAGLVPEDVMAQLREKAAAGSPNDESASARMLRGVLQDHRTWFKAHEEREQLRAAWGEFFQDYDVLLCPASSMPAFPHDQARDRTERKVVVNGRDEEFNTHVPGFWAGIANLPYLPSTVAPAGRTGTGLPVGVQILGPYLEDHTTIEFARLLAQVTEGFVPPPAYR